MAEPLTVIIPCKNERANIAACIASTRLVADEILVADSGSDDGTQELVRAMGDCRLVERDWIGYAAFKNWAIPQATHPWVLIVDADERVTPQLAEEIKLALAETPDHIDGYWVPRQNHLLGHEATHGGWARDRVFRLLRRDRCRYKARLVHEEVDVPARNAGALRQPLLHYTFWTWDQWLAKIGQYAQLDAQQQFKKGRRPSWLRMLVQPPLRFLRDFVLYRGFLDGMVGLQISWSSAFYCFMKQARLWELHHGKNLETVEADSQSLAA